MANKKITELNAASSLAATDVVPVVDVSADETKKITATDLFRTLPDGTAAAPALAFSSDAANGVYLAGTDTVGISTGGTQRVTVDGSGNVSISGDLQVNGATTTVQSTTVTIDDKNIELGSVASPSNTTADGGGITLKGATDKEIKWVNSTGYWTFNTGIEVGGHIQLDDSNKAIFGTGGDLEILHNGANSFITNFTGDLYILNHNDDKDILLQTDNGSGGTTTYVLCDGSTGSTKLNYLGSEKLQTKSDGILVQGEVQSDSLDVNGAADITGTVTLHGNLDLQDSDSIFLGTGDDLRLFHNGSTSHIQNDGGGLFIDQNVDDGDISLRSDNGSGSLANYLVCDGSDGKVRLYYYGTQKFSTRSDGINVTGEVECDSLDVDGNADISGDISISGGNKTVQTTAGFLQVGTSSSNHLAFLTDGSERGRIDSVGRLILGTTDEGQVNADNFTVADGANCGITIRSGSSNIGSIFFSDATSGTGEYAGFVDYNHSSDKLSLGTASTTRVYIDSLGNLGIGNASPVNSTGFKTLTIGNGTDTGGQIHLEASNGNNFQIWHSTTDVNFYAAQSVHQRFYTAGSERLRLDSSGRLLLGTTTEGSGFADNLTVADSGNSGITIRSGTSSHSSIYFSDGTSGDAEYRGYLLYDHSDDGLRFGTEAVERFRITSTGAWSIEGANNYGTSGQVLTSNGNDAPTWQDAGAASVGGASAISMNDNVNINFGASNDLQIFHDGSNSVIRENGTGALTIQSNGGEIAVFDFANSQNMGRFITAGAVELYHNGNKKFETKSDGVDITGELQCDSLDVDGAADITGILNLGNNLDMPDNAKVILGTGDDLQIYHDGSHSYVKDAGTGELRLESDAGGIRIQRASGHTGIFYNVGGQVELYYDNSKKFETKSDGVDVTGEVQCTSLDVNGTANISGTTVFQGDVGIGNTTPGNSFDNGKSLALGDNDTGIRQAGDGILEFWCNNQERMTVHHNGTIYSRNHFVPHNSNSVDLGGSNNRWRNVYTNDLHLSNEGSTNDVDGTWGNYTIQEGEDDLFLINRRNGKKYKFNLTEVS